MPITIDLTPDTLDLVLYAGDGCDFQISFVDNTNMPIDVSSWSWNAQIRKVRSSVDYIPLEINTTNASNGILILGVSSTITTELASSLTNTSSQWDLESIPAGGSPITILQGSVICNLDVTR